MTTAPSADSHRIAAIVLGAGKGNRMRSRLPKVLHRIGNRPMILHTLEAVRAAGAQTSVVVVAPDMDSVADAVAPTVTVVQHEQLGTADAVKPAREVAGCGFETVLILYGDTPFISAETLEAMVALRANGEHGVVALGFRPKRPGAYGRLVLSESGELKAIVEAKDANATQSNIGLCNSGAMAVDGTILFELIDQVGNENASGEYYLTDIVEIACRQGRTCGVVEADPDELLGINSRAELASAEQIFQQKKRSAAMEGGATLVDPETVWFSHDTVIGQDVIIEPQVIFGPGVALADNVEIKAFSHIEGATVANGAVVGPFARLRPATSLQEGARVGNFVEVKAALLKSGAKVAHLAYIGDAEIGTEANIGAGTITCNYDGFLKSRTIVGDGAFIGSNTALVAPVTIGKGAIVGAGSTIAADVAEDALALTRAEHTAIPRAAAKFRDRKKAEKAKQAPEKKG